MEKISKIIADVAPMNRLNGLLTGVVYLRVDAYDAYASE
jgi:hypothetical protein